MGRKRILNPPKCHPDKRSEDLLLVTMTCKDEWEAMEYEGKWGGYYHPVANKEGNRVFHDPGTKKGSTDISA
jgi:hypothetical protein